MLTAAQLTIRLHPNDDVVIARAQLIGGTQLQSEGVTVKGMVPPGHKVATKAIAQGAPVRRYNQIIGFASKAITAGEHVHVNNLAMGETFARDYAFGVDVRPVIAAMPQATFMGIKRADGRVATRNYIGLLSTVNCSATVCKLIADHFRAGQDSALKDYPNVDGVVAVTHSVGCGMDVHGEGMTLLRRTLAGYARHVNFHSVLVIGLGCEANQISSFKAAEGLDDGPRLHSFNMQDVGGTGKAVAKGINLVKSMLDDANKVTRESVPASHITIGLQCGGSDGYSGISANPALGAAVDLLVAHGGTAILSETPEIYGAEHLLTRRAVTREVGEKLVARIKWWEEYTERLKGEMNNNPSPGNKAGGLTTILEKSLGAVAKGGTTPLVDVYEYAQAVDKHGFVYMDTPGYDPVSATGQVAGGANLICFTTGRGSAYGCKPSPSLKLATNNALWERQPDDIDINCGDIVDSGVAIADKGREIFEMILATASGKASKSERWGYGADEFVPWYIGAVM